MLYVPLEEDGLSQPQGKTVLHIFYSCICCTYSFPVSYTLLNTRIGKTIMLYLSRSQGCQADGIAHEVLQQIILQRLANENNFTTNAVESHNRCSKGSSPDILKVALMATYMYKIDMAATLEHLAKRSGTTTSYEDLSPASRATRTKVANQARSRKRAASDNAESPPDKHQDFIKGVLVINLLLALHYKCKYK